MDSQKLPKQSRFSWQNGYAAFSVSFSQMESVAGYIDNQERHHQRKRFEEELLWLLKVHQVKFDQRYLWD